MLKLFQSIFGGEAVCGRYPEGFIDAAIERAVDGTDPRLRALPGYKNQLRQPVTHALDHVVALVESIPSPLKAGHADYSVDPRLMALFASVEHMHEVFSNDAALNEFRSHPGGGAEPVIAVLLAERVEKHVLGVDLIDDRLRRDVAQVAVSFRNHRLVELTTDEADTRHLLKRRAFDHLLALALARIAEMQGERADLTRHRDLLRRKLSALERCGWCFEALEGVQFEPETASAELQEIETALTDLGADAGALQARLEVVADLLGHADRHLWAEELVMHLDRMNILRSAQDASAQRIALHELHNARGWHLVLLLVALVPAELPLCKDVIAAAERYLV